MLVSSYQQRDVREGHVRHKQLQSKPFACSCVVLCYMGPDATCVVHAVQQAQRQPATKRAAVARAVSSVTEAMQATIQGVRWPVSWGQHESSVCKPRCCPPTGMVCCRTVSQHAALHGSSGAAWKRNAGTQAGTLAADATPHPDASGAAVSNSAPEADRAAAVVAEAVAWQQRKSDDANAAMAALLVRAQFSRP